MVAAGRLDRRGRFTELNVKGDHRGRRLLTGGGNLTAQQGKRYGAA
jgi:hypothetical protein